MDGQALSWGNNVHGQLGRGPLAEERAESLDAEAAASSMGLPSPVEVELFDDEWLVEVSAGAFHSLAVTSSGYLFAFGNCRAGQCGFASGEPALSPTTPSPSERGDEARNPSTKPRPLRQTSLQPAPKPTPAPSEPSASAPSPRLEASDDDESEDSDERAEARPQLQSRD